MRWRLLGLGIGACAVGTAAYVLGLVAMTPATMLDAGVQRASSGRLRVADARGALWSGTGQIEIRDADGNTRIAESIAWRFSPATLIRGYLACEVELGRSGKRMQAAIRPSQIEFSDADLELPAAVLGALLPKLAPLRLTGEILIHAAHLTIRHDGSRGSATVIWRAAGSALTPVAPLGEFELRLQREGAVTHASLRTIMGPLFLDGSGSWADAPAFTVTARVSKEHAPELVPLLRLIATERGDGRYEAQLK